MLTETGRVVAVESDSLWVETIRQSTCGQCSASKGCGHGLLGRIGDGRRHLIRVLAGAQSTALYEVDQSVRIGIPEQVLLKSSVVVYAVPLLCLLLGASAVSGVRPGWDSDIAAMAGALAGLLVGIGLVRWHAARHRNDPELQPRLLGPVQGYPHEPVTVNVQG